MLVITFQSRAMAGFLRSVVCMASLRFSTPMWSRMSHSEKCSEIPACYYSKERLKVDRFCLDAQHTAKVAVKSLSGEGKRTKGSKGHQCNIFMDTFKPVTDNKVRAPWGRVRCTKASVFNVLQWHRVRWGMGWLPRCKVAKIPPLNRRKRRGQ